MMIRVLIVDDHGIVRKGLRMYLGTDPELEVVGEASNGREAVEQAQKLQPDVVLMDLLMPVMDGIAATATIRSQMPDVEILALTSMVDDSVIVRALGAGATGYLLKDAEQQDLCDAVHAVAEGRMELAPIAAKQLIGAVSKQRRAEALTDREHEILRLVALGKSNSEIARELGIGEQTVKTHVSHILAKLGMPSRTMAALYAIQIGLAGPPPPAGPAPCPDTSGDKTSVQELKRSV